MSPSPPARSHFIAVIAATIAALTSRAWLRLELLEAGMQKDAAADLSYLVVPPLLVVLLLPVWLRHRQFIAALFGRNGLTVRLACQAMAIGLLLRLAAWCQLVAGVSFGWYRNADTNATAGPTFVFHCAEPPLVALGVAVMVVLVPLIEELTNRGLLQSWLAHRGACFSVACSTLIFTLSHRPSSWPFVFLAGLVFGIQFWQARSIWYSLITHATVNGLIQIDWRCLHGHWNPSASELPRWVPGIASTCILVLAIFVIVYLLWRKQPGCRTHPGNETITERLQSSR